MKPTGGGAPLAVACMLLTAGMACAGVLSPGMEQRQVNQQQRIQQGVASGQLTPLEAGRLEAEQVRIQQREERMKSDGQLTLRERRRLHREQDRASRAIYRKKHNGRSLDNP